MKDGTIPHLVLSADETELLEQLVTKVASLSGSQEEVFSEACIAAHAMPERLRRALLDLKRDDDGIGAMVVTGLPTAGLDDRPTPVEIRSEAELDWAVSIMFLVGSILGEPVGWQSHQGGRLVQDVAPIRKEADKHLGTGSAVPLELHTESAYDPNRPDWLLLLTIRNEQRIPTLVAPVGKLDTSDPRLKPLFEPHFGRPSFDVLRANSLSQLDESALEAELASIALQPMLYGSAAAPYVQYDAYYFDPPADPEAQSAVSHFEAMLSEAVTPICLERGELLILNNHRVVHGRPAYQPRFDGGDRWLKRLCIHGDVRRTRTLRTNAADRVLNL